MNMQPYRAVGNYASRCHAGESMLPDPKVAACAIWSISVLFPGSVEPYRRAAWELGWYDQDGSAWWTEVMNLVDNAEDMLALTEAEKAEIATHGALGTWRTRTCILVSG